LIKKIWNALGLVKYRWKNQVKEWIYGREEQFHYDLRLIGPMVRTAYYNPKPFAFNTRVMLLERVVEYPLAFQSLPLEPATILDVGSGNSPFPYHLACLGHTVHTVDILPYPLHHPNIIEHQCDAMNLPFGNESYKFVTAISSLEHFGLGGYSDPVKVDAPFQARQEVRRVLKNKGTFIVSFPVGRESDPVKSKKANYRVFTPALHSRFIHGFNVAQQRFFQHADHHWLPCTGREAFGRDSYSQGTMAIVFMVLTKPLK
jgi:SAM-dependent methyltransferase